MFFSEVNSGVEGSVLQYLSWPVSKQQSKCLCGRLEATSWPCTEKQSSSVLSLGQGLMCMHVMCPALILWEACSSGLCCGLPIGAHSAWRRRRDFDFSSMYLHKTKIHNKLVDSWLLVQAFSVVGLIPGILFDGSRNAFAIKPVFTRCPPFT